ncbi:MAG: hypothetical protein HFE83_02395 [Lachnospiraceae bacterium]|jgi:hypothetical protein|nr:hypothetical protein [Lachnospiraceae bacterium]
MHKVKNTCSIYLIFGQKLKLPVNPDEIEIQRAANHKTYDVLGLGEIVVPGKPALTTVSWESFFPALKEAPYVNAGAKSARIYTSLFEKAMREKTVGRLIISRSGSFDTNMRCLIDSFQTKDKGGEPGDVYYSIELKEYREYTPETVAILSAAGVPDEKVEAAAEPQRAVETPILRVGASVIANGKYWYDSYGSKPFGTANNISTTVTRIVEGNPYPVHIGSYGWLKADQLQITG